MKEEQKKKEKENHYFYIPKDLDIQKQTNYFQKAGDLDSNKQDNYFQKAGDLEENREDTEILESAGNILVTPEQLNEMLKEGYHIIKADNCGPFISVQFEQINTSRKRGR